MSMLPTVIGNLVQASVSAKRLNKFINSEELPINIIHKQIDKNVPISINKSFFQWNLWGHLPTTIIVMVAINQPFTLWMLHSFFLNIPKEMDESAMVDGCTRFQAFRHVIIPVMWPGVITTGLFSFLLAYNDFTVTALLLSQENQTMIPKINSFSGSTQVKGNIMFAVAAVVSATLPLFILVMFFQRQIVSGLTAGAVKG
jgi:multiple sugar transport system permease protein